MFYIWFFLKYTNYRINVIYFKINVLIKQMKHFKYISSFKEVLMNIKTLFLEIPNNT